MSIEKPSDYIITYSNFLEFNNRKLSFRKGLLFDITATPVYIHFNKNEQVWSVSGKPLTKSNAESLVVRQSISVDVSNLQWYAQCHLDECFNLTN